VAYNNFFTGQRGEQIEPPLTDEKALLILPEMGGHGIYKILRDKGATVETAVVCVLSKCVGDIEAYEKILSEYGLR
jgi:hypothetical protein